MRRAPPALLLGLAAALAAGTPAVAEEEAPPGASSCLGCHAPARAGAAIPALAGRDAAAVAAALRDFREGRRAATVMDRLARGFSETESQAIAAWIVRR